MIHDSDFRQTILNIPEQFQTGSESAKSVKFDQKKFDKIVLCGMGGSMMPAEILMTLCEVTQTPNYNFYIHRDYELPSWVSKNDLVICVSWSGNTDETISSYKSAIEKGIQTVVITKGGKLRELAQNSLGFILLPQENIPPRIGTAYMFSALLTFLNDSAILKFPENNILKQLLDLKNTLKPEELEITGKNIANQINNLTPIIYSSYKWRALPLLWKINFNENAKAHSFWNHFPSIAHNEIVGFESSKNFYSILLSDPQENPKQIKKLDVAVKILSDLSINHQVITLEGDNVIQKIFTNYTLAIWTSYFMAINSKQDPSNNELLDRFKDLEKLTA
ncbi:MAG: SIS domain-containing protein [Parcubacteria group bacterium]|nr:SIS domain-containing protein [Parcubacteria group bacterium]